MMLRSTELGICIGLTAVLSGATGFAAEPDRAPDSHASASSAANMAEWPSVDEITLDIRKAAATDHFNRGLQLFLEGRLEPALDAFLLSRALYPKPKVAENAAFCLERLGRDADAYWAYNAILREFPNLSPSERERIEQKRNKIWATMGILELAGGVKDATVLVNGKQVGTLPLPGPIGLRAGSYNLRVIGSGTEPYEARITLAAGQQLRKYLELKPLPPTNNLFVSTDSDRDLFLHIDGLRVGKLPWSGPVGLGNHYAILTNWGKPVTEPFAINIPDTRHVHLKVAEEEGDVLCLVRIVPEPMDARLFLRDVQLGKGIWEGRLKGGNYIIVADAPGFQQLVALNSLPRQRCTKEPGKVHTINIKLKAVDTKSPTKIQNRKGAFLDVTTGMVILPSLAGEPANDCINDPTCSVTTPMGGAFAIHLGYAMGNKLDLGVSVGYLGARQTTSARFLNGAVLEDTGIVDDVSVNGATVENFVGYSPSGVPIHLKLVAGIMMGVFDDTRSGKRFTLNTPTIKPFTQSGLYASMVVGAGVAARYAVGDHVELGLGVDLRLAFLLRQPRWDSTADVPILPTGTTRFVSEPLLDRTLIYASPFVAAQYRF